MEQAARLTDPVGHGFGFVGMVVGAVVGGLLVAGAIAGTVASGGLLGAALIAGGVAGGGLFTGKLVNAIQHIMGLPNPTTGLLNTGSRNVVIGDFRRHVPEWMP